MSAGGVRLAVLRRLLAEEERRQRGDEPTRWYELPHHNLADALEMHSATAYLYLNPDERDVAKQLVQGIDNYLDMSGYGAQGRLCRQGRGTQGVTLRRL